MDKEQIMNAITHSYKNTSEGFLIDHNILADKILKLADSSKEEPKGVEELKQTLKERLKFYFYEDVEEKPIFSLNETTKNIFNDLKSILPHLSGVSNTKSSDAVEFSEWIAKKGIKPSCSEGMWLIIENDDEIKSRPNTQELYTEFLKSKGITPVEKDETTVTVTLEANKLCSCLKCSPNEYPNIRFNTCSICGNKRCPHADDHNFKCTNSNDVGQIGTPIK